MKNIHENVLQVAQIANSQSAEPNELHICPYVKALK